MYQEFDYDVVREMDSLEDPRSACEVALSLLRVFLVVFATAPTFGVSAEPRYSGDDVMLGCNEWLVSWPWWSTTEAFAQTDSTAQGLQQGLAFALRNCACL
jgi:hypothetical protein